MGKRTIHSPYLVPHPAITILYYTVDFSHTKSNKQTFFDNIHKYNKQFLFKDSIGKNQKENGNTAATNISFSLN